MVGASVCRLLQSQHPEVELVLRSRQDLDLTQASQVDRFFQETKPDAVIFAAAKVGGILANASFPVEFLSENVRMAINAIESAHRSGVQRFLFLGSTCIYPKHAPQPLCEPSLLSSPLESTNEAYALAKIVGLKLCQYYRTQFKAVYHSAMPTNLYGPGDNYHPEHSHVIPGLLRRIHEAKVQNAPTVTLWGSGTGSSFDSRFAPGLDQRRDRRGNLDPGTCKTDRQDRWIHRNLRPRYQQARRDSPETYRPEPHFFNRLESQNRTGRRIGSHVSRFSNSDRTGKPT